jgi:hypothetical protein
MNRPGDAFIGLIGTAGTFTLANFNVLLGCIAGLMTCCYMGLKLKKEYRDRDK